MEKSQIPTVLVYDQDSNYEPVGRGIREYFSGRKTFKYVLFRVCGKANSYSSHFLRLSPLHGDEGELWSDTHLTIIGKTIKEFTTKWSLTIGDLCLEQDSGHGLLWIIKKVRSGGLRICAEVGGFMKIRRDGSILFSGESEALKGGQVCSAKTDSAMSNLLIRIFDEYKHHKKYHEGKDELPEDFNDFAIINPIHSVPALLIEESVNQVKIYLPTLCSAIIEFKPTTIEKIFSPYFKAMDEKFLK